jgi:hypothetical protein
MYELVRHTLLQKLLPQQLVSGGAAFIIANQFYQFHSFALECLAFLVTWGAFDFLTQKLMELFGAKRRRH